MSFPTNPKTMALLNVDLQNCFVEKSPIAPPCGLEVLDKVNQLTHASRSAGIKIIHTAHVTRPDGSNMGIMKDFLPPVKDGIIHQGQESAKLHPKLDVQDGDIILEKPRFGAFYNTDLECILRSSGIDTVMITGICTNVCCETTAREANMRDFKVFFLNDATGTFPLGEVSAEQIQAAVCATLGMFFAEVLSVNEMIRKIEQR
jgi:biuret amidohydrolase